MHNHGNKNTERHFKFTGSSGPEVDQGLSACAVLLFTPTEFTLKFTDEFFRTSGVPGLLEAALEGYSCTCFAYGQTGSGKTYTLSGEAETGRAEHNEGLTRRALRYVFHRVGELQAQGCSVKVRASYCEVYNEQVFDLLSSVDTSSDMGAVAAPLHVRGGKRGFFADGITIADCDGYSTAAAVLQRGHSARRVRSHKLNEHSSRSHSLFTLEMEVTRPLAPGTASTARGRRRSTAAGDSITHSGKIVFVDLAGSERLKRSGAAGDGRKETGAINKSLFALAKVISAVAAAQQAAAEADASGPPDPTFDEVMAGKLRKRRHSKVAGGSPVASPGTPPDAERSNTARPSSTASYIPYRDSTLTKLLMNSLGGDSRTIMIACVSPAHVHLEESLNTLSYAQRAAKIRNSAVLHTNAGKVGGAAQGIISNLKAEIEQLRAENAALRASSSSPRQSPEHARSPYEHPGELQPPSPAFGVLSPQQRLLDQRMREASPAAVRSEPFPPPQQHRQMHVHLPGQHGGGGGALQYDHQQASAQAVHSEPVRSPPRGALQADGDIRVSAVTQSAGMAVLGSGRAANERRGGPNGPRKAPLKRSTSAVPTNSKKGLRAQRAAAVADPPSTAPSGAEGQARRQKGAVREPAPSAPHLQDAAAAALAVGHGRRRSVAFQDSTGEPNMARKLPAPTPITSPQGSPSRGDAGEGFASASPKARGGGHRRSSYGSAFSPDGQSPLAKASGSGSKPKHGRRAKPQSDSPQVSPIESIQGEPGADGQLTPAQLDALIAEEMGKVEALKAAKTPQKRALAGRRSADTAATAKAEQPSTPTRAALAEKQRLQRENEALRRKVREAKATARTARGTRIPKIRKDDGAPADESGRPPSSPLQSPTAHNAPGTTGAGPGGMQLPSPAPYHPPAFMAPHQAPFGQQGHPAGVVPQLPLMSPAPDGRWLTHGMGGAPPPHQWHPEPYMQTSMGMGVSQGQSWQPDPYAVSSASAPWGTSQPFSGGAAVPSSQPGKAFTFNVPLSPAANGSMGPIPVSHGGPSWQQAPGLGVGMVEGYAPVSQFSDPYAYGGGGGSVHYGSMHDASSVHRLGTADTMGSFHTSNMDLVPPSSHTPVPPQPAPTPLPRAHDLYGHPGGVGSSGMTVQMHKPLNAGAAAQHGDPLAQWKGSFRDGGVAASLAVQATTSMGSLPRESNESSSPANEDAHLRFASPIPSEVGSPINAGRLTPRGTHRAGSTPQSDSRPGSGIAREQAQALQRKLDAMARREMHLLARMDHLERNIASPAGSNTGSPKAAAGGVWVDSGRVIAGEDSPRVAAVGLGGVGSPVIDDADEDSAGDEASPAAPPSNIQRALAAGGSTGSSIRKEARLEGDAAQDGEDARGSDTAGSPAGHDEHGGGEDASGSDTAGSPAGHDEHGGGEDASGSDTAGSPAGHDEHGGGEDESGGVAMESVHAQHESE